MKEKVNFICKHENCIQKKFKENYIIEMVIIKLAPAKCILY